MTNIPTTLNELAEELGRRVANAKSSGDKLVMVEWWELDSILIGEFVKPDDPDATHEEHELGSTGELSNEQIAALVHRDKGQMPTQPCKSVD